MKPKILAKDVMQREIIVVPQDLDVWGLARLFTERGISGAPVVDGDDELVGVVSQTDIVRHLGELTRAFPPPLDFYAQQEVGGEPAVRPATARTLMSRDVISAGPETSAAEISRMMLLRRVHRIIITEGRKVLGIVTTTDLLKVL